MARATSCAEATSTPAAIVRNKAARSAPEDLPKVSKACDAAMAAVFSSSTLEEA